MSNDSIPPWQWSETDWRSAVGHVRAGPALKPAKWPGGARAAVALSFDCDHETFEMGAGGKVIGRLAWGEFGRRVGVPRILDCLKRYDVAASFFMPAVVALLDPDEPKRIRDQGHEIGMHGWIHENNSLLGYDDERDLMFRAFENIDKDKWHRTNRLPVCQLGHRSAHDADRQRTRACLRQLNDG